MIMNWREFVLTEELSVSLVSVFTSVLINERALHTIEEVDLCGETIRTLRKVFSTFADLSCDSTQVQLLGQPTFKGIPEYEDCLQIALRDSANICNFSMLNLPQIFQI
jgi:hypothetical protein